jgi:hypothetical protein
MQSVYLQNAAAPTPPPLIDFAAGTTLQLLQNILLLSQKWSAHLAANTKHNEHNGHGLQHEAILHLESLTDSLIKQGNAPPLAMTHVRALLCSSCRNLNMSQGQCAGVSLEHCLLLQAEADVSSSVSNGR